MTTAKVRSLLLTTLVWALITSAEIQPYRKSQDLGGACNPTTLNGLQCKLTAPIATLELSTNPAQFTARIDQGNTKLNRNVNVRLASINTYLDFPFIVIYATAFVVLARWSNSRFLRWILCSILLAAALDLVENAFLLFALKGVANGVTAFLTPGWASYPKWLFFASATTLLGISNLSRKWRDLLVGVPLLLSGVATLIGLFSIAFLGLGVLLLFVALLVMLLLLLPPKEERLKWLNYLYFIRFSLGLWLIMPILALLDWMKITSSVSLGILTPDDKWPLFFCSFFIVASGWLALTLARIVCAYGKERFGTDPPSALEVGRTMRWSTFLFAQVPGLILMLRIALNARVEGEVPLSTIVVWMVAGAWGAFIFWVVVAILYYWTYQPTYKRVVTAKTTAKAFLIPDAPYLRLDEMEALPNPPVASLVRNVLTRVSALGEGYQREDEKDPKNGGAISSEHKLHSGHSIALFLFFGYLALYIGLMGITSPRPLPLVESITRSLVALVVLIATISYFVGRKSPGAGEQAVPVPPTAKTDAVSVPVENVSLEAPQTGDHAPQPSREERTSHPSWYNWLSRFAVVFQFFVAIVIFIQPRSERSFPVVASVFVLFTFATLALAGLAFWADRFRIPVLTLALLVIAGANIRPMRADHQFEGVELAKAPPPQTPDAVFTAMEPGGKVRPLIIVTATGGGIHAAMWTAEVLSLLERNFPKTDAASGIYGFHDSILLTSTVSGGSVGMMNFLREYQNSSAFDRAHLDDHLVKPAACSSLEAVAWGLIYPDMNRLLFPLLFRSESLAPFDRGLALEEAIDDNLKYANCSLKSPRNNSQDDPTLSALPPGLTNAGSFFPAFTLNTTATETGDRFLLSNYQIGLKDDKYCDSDTSNLHSDILPAESFLQSYAEPCPSDAAHRHLADLHLSTAARLSGTFTYVSPAARIEPKFAQNAYHFVDGGYFDNDGTGSVIEFLQALSGTRKLPQDKIQPILLIEIRNGSDMYSDRSPDSYSCQEAHCTTSNEPTPWGPWRQLTSPAQAMYLAGHESITRRNRRELCILEQSLAAHVVEKDKWSGGVVIHHVVFSVNDGDAAMSWHLTPKQKDFLRSVLPDQGRWDGKKWTPVNGPGEEQTQKSLTDALNWFNAAQKNPNAAHGEDVCRVYP